MTRISKHFYVTVLINLVMNPYVKIARVFSIHLWLLNNPELWHFRPEIFEKMYKSEFLLLLQHRVRVGTILKCLPFKFDKKSDRLYKSRSPWQLRIFKLQCALSVCYAMVMFANLCFGPLTMTGRMQGIGFFIVYFAATLMQWNYSLDIAPIQIINSFLNFEEEIISSKENLCRI